MTSTGISRTLAEHVAGSDPSTADDARVAGRHSLLDTVGVIMAGSRQPDAEAVVRLVKRWAGAEEATVVSHGLRVPAHHAAFANGAMAHQWDYDDTHDAAALHPSAVTIPAALAAAEIKGGVSGRELLDAIIVGNDLVSRLGASIKGMFIDYPWMRPQIIGTFGAAATAGRLLGLDADGVEHAFGVALPQTSGTSASVMSSGSSIRSIRDGFANQAGVLAALLAAEGIKGDPLPFEGDYGLFTVFFRDEIDHSVLLDDLGDFYAGVDISFKRWPCCRPTHNALTAFFSLLSDTGLAVDDIDSVRMSIGRWTYRRCHGSKADYEWPASKIDAHCDLPFIMSVALATGGVSLADFAEMQNDDPRLARALERLDWHHDERMDGSNRTMEPVELTVRTVTGDTHVATSDFGYGHPSNPLTTDDLLAKFMECGEFAGGRSPEQLERVASLCLSIDDVTDIAELTALL